MHTSTSISLLSFLAAIAPSIAAPPYPILRRDGATQQQCDAYTPIASGAYDVQNDAWGAVPGGTSCVQIDSGNTSGSSSSVAWSTTFDWSGSKDAIKSFQNAQAAKNTPCKPLSQYRTMPSTWSWTYGSTAVSGDVAYDAFLAPECNQPGDKHTYEVMVWLAQLGGLNPIADGAPSSGIKLAGSSWKLYEGKNAGTGTYVYSFVADSQINDFSGDLMEFFNYLVKSKGVDAGLMMTTMQAGTEVSVGKGTFKTTRYEIAST